MSVAEQKAVKEADKLKKIDFKMVSFTLAGKDYGIDILKVKEIRKAGNFTHVPNTPVYVRGVDNLRGDIIPIIDLRMMFNLPAETKENGGLENIIILRLDELILGIIVDNIEKVVGISKESIQPPHPIFGDINVKYISGVVENDGRLYIILDVDRIFGQPAEPEIRKVDRPLPEAPMAVAPEAPVPEMESSSDSLEVQFLKETLVTFADFHGSILSDGWVQKRAKDWKQERTSKGLDYQLNGREDAGEFLRPFYSAFTGQLWNPDDLKSLVELLDWEGSQVTVWNPGCGQGYETYSLYCGLAARFPEKGIKMWANDKDLLNISMAPSLAFPEVPEEYKPYMVQTKSGWQFNTETKSRILFEYHDITHMNPFSDLHLIVCRDTVCFLKPSDQERLLGDFSEKIRVGGYLILGKNEKLSNSEEWQLVDHDLFTVYQKI